MTFVKTSLYALAAAAITAPAFADPASLARSVGVEPGVYSVQQLVTLQGLEDGNRTLRQFILDNPEGSAAAVSSRASHASTAAVDKLAGNAGVEPGKYSLQQLIELQGLGDGDNAHRAYILKNPAYGD